MHNLTHGSLFTGFGMFDYAADKAGLKNIWQVENNEFCQKLLKVRYPNAKRFTDIKEVTGEQLGYVDVVSGGFPCQPFSIAGKRNGKDDNRYLWKEMLRIITEIKPTYVIGENVTGILNMGIEYILLDLENEGYEVESFIIPACAVKAVHRRDRVWIIAYNNKIRCNRDKSKGEGIQRQNETRNEVRSGNKLFAYPPISNDRTHNGEQEERQAQEFGESVSGKAVTNNESQRLEGSIKADRSKGQEPDDKQFNGCNGKRNWLEAATLLCGVDASPSTRIHKPEHRKHRLEGLGNGIQWEIAYILFESIKELNKE